MNKKDFRESLLSNYLVEPGLECYYCEENGGEEHDRCTSDIVGEPVPCQMYDPEGPHFGDVCAVGHVGKYLSNYIQLKKVLLLFFMYKIKSINIHFSFQSK